MLSDWLKQLRQDWPWGTPRVRKSRRYGGPTIAARVQTLEPRVLLSATPLGTEFLVNTYTTGSQRESSVAMDADGDFLVAWHSNGQDGSGYGIFAQRYNAAGAALGTEFRVNSYTTGNQTKPSVAMDADGDFVIAWASYGQDGSGNGVYAQRYNAVGVPQGKEFRVNVFTTGGQHEPAVAMDADGDFIITWHSPLLDGGNLGIFAQRYNASGVAQGSEFQVNTYTTGVQAFPGSSRNLMAGMLWVW